MQDTTVVLSPLLSPAPTAGIWDALYRMTPGSSSKGPTDTNRSDSIDVIGISNHILQSILTKLSDNNVISNSNNSNKKRELYVAIYNLSNTFASTSDSNCVDGASPTATNSLSYPTVDEFKLFCKSIHNYIISGDSSLRPILLRVIRICLTTPQHCDVIVTEEIHWLIVLSLEKDSDEYSTYVSERMQAIKIYRRFMCLAPLAFPIAFARSLVAVSNSSEDSLRRVCIETIRELSLFNLPLVVTTTGLQSLINTVLDPSMYDMVESIVLTLLHLLNDSNTRKVLKPSLDLRSIFSPFIDFDTDDSILSSRWKSAKLALVTTMRTFVGAVQMTSDPLALPTILGLLSDPKISTSLKHVILDAVSEILEPMTSTAQDNNWTAERFTTASSMTTNESNNDLASAVELESLDSSAQLDSRSSSERPSSSMFKNVNTGRHSSFDGKGDSNYKGDSSTTSASSIVSQQAKSILGLLSRASGPFMSPTFKNRRPSSVAFSAGTGTNATTTIATAATANRITTTSDTSVVAERRDSRLSTSNIFGFSSSASLTATSSTSSLSNQSETSQRASITANGFAGESYMSPTSTQGRKVFNRDDGELGNLNDSGSKANTHAKNDDAIDLLYNLIDNYSSIVCCSLYHCNIIDSLCYLGINGDNSIAIKSRQLLVEFLRICSRIFPENKCSDILINHSLVQYASASSTDNIISSRASKASQILLALSTAFTTSTIIRSNASVSSRSEDVVKPTSYYSNVRTSLSNRMSTSGMTASISNPTMLTYQSSVVKNLCDLTVELLANKVSSCATTTTKGSGYNDSLYMKDILNCLKRATDKAEFGRLVELSKITSSKDGKEPLKWDWNIINDMLDGAFTHPDRVIEASQCKWFKRLTGFYRCALDDKGQDRFFCIDWEINNLHFGDCLCAAVDILLHDTNGFSIIKNERNILNFSLLQEMSREMVQLFNHSTSGIFSTAVSKNLFRFGSCRCSMAREYFTLLGYIVRTMRGKTWLDGCPQLFTCFTQLGGRRNLDYVSRLVLNAFIFSDGGSHSRHLIMTWAGDCSASLKLYMHSLLRALLRERPLEFNRWCVDILMQQLDFDDTFPYSIVPILEEAAESQLCLKSIIARRPKLNLIVAGSSSEHLLTRFLSVSEGIKYLLELRVAPPTPSATASATASATTATPSTPTPCAEKMSWIQYTMQEFLSCKYKAYAVNIEKSFGRILNKSYLKKKSSGVTSIAFPLHESSASHSDVINTFVSNNGVDLEAMCKVPWNIEVKLSSQAGYQQSGSEYLKVDCYLDASELPSHITSVVTESHRTIVIKGVLLDQKGHPTAIPIQPQRIISSTLLVGTNPLRRDGTITPVSNSIRRKSASVSVNASTTPMQNAFGRHQFNSTSQNSSSSSSNSSNETYVEEPITQSNDGLYDWSKCLPSDRQGIITDLGNNLFSVEKDGEPVIWVFSRSQMLQNNRSGKNRSSSIASIDSMYNRETKDIKTSGRQDTSRLGGVCYLVEVLYILKVDTGQRLFSPIPRHVLGELSKCAEGIAILTEYDAVASMLRIAYDEEKESNRDSLMNSSSSSSSSSSANRRGAIWSLGHIMGASDMGYKLVDRVEPGFIAWCIDRSTKAPNYSVRATCFYVLGLISRSKKGSKKLHTLQWDSAPVGSRSAVAVPRNIACLFEHHSHKEEKGVKCGPATLNHPDEASMLTPFVTSITIPIEMEILNCIAKLPGPIPGIYKQAKSKLEYMSSYHPDAFNNRALYVTVMKFMETYMFKLEVRKDIVKLFSVAAKCNKC